MRGADAKSRRRIHRVDAVADLAGMDASDNPGYSVDARSGRTGSRFEPSPAAWQGRCILSGAAADHARNSRSAHGRWSPGGRSCAVARRALPQVTAATPDQSAIAMLVRAAGAGNTDRTTPCVKAGI
jgi:hypothetical protein